MLTIHLPSPNFRTPTSWCHLRRRLPGSLSCGSCRHSQHYVRRTRRLTIKVTSRKATVDVRPRESVIVLYDLFGAKGFDLAGGYQRCGDWRRHKPDRYCEPVQPGKRHGFDRQLPSLASLRVAISQVRNRLLGSIFSAAILPVDQIDFTALGNTQSIFNLQDLSSATRDSPN